MSFKPNIDYFISFDGSENTTKVKVDLCDVESIGLEECLKKKVNFPFMTYDIKYRKIFMTDYNTYLSKKESVGEKRSDYGKPKYAAKPYKSKEKKAYSDEKETKFRVYVSDLIETEHEFIEVYAINSHKAIVRALHKAKVFEFPEGWERIYVEEITEQGNE